LEKGARKAEELLAKEIKVGSAAIEEMKAEMLLLIDKERRIEAEP